MVEVRFHNRNDFDVWVKVDRRISSVDGATSPEDSGTLIERVKSQSHFGIPDEPIQFPRPLYPAQVASGTFDYHLCYGRTRESMTKGFTIAGTFRTQFEDGGKITIGATERVRKEGSCDAE